MEAKHQEAFFRAAEELQCWIGVREPNPLANRWIGNPKCAPKPKSCGAKTADNVAHPLAGLVVNPHICPTAFRDASAAKKSWDEWFKKNLGRLPHGYSEATGGREAGLVKLTGKSLYSDFDLMAIVRSNEHGEFLPTSRTEQREAYVKVRRSINRNLGIPMVQHGPEMDYPKVGAKASEWVFWFGPGRGFRRGPSSMPKNGH